MIVALIVISIVGLCGWIYAGISYGLNFELRCWLKDVTFQRDQARQEVQELTDALARANRTPVVRAIATTESLHIPSPPPYWEGPMRIVKVSAES